MKHDIFHSILHFYCQQINVFTLCNVTRSEIKKNVMINLNNKNIILLKHDTNEQLVDSNPQQLTLEH